MCAIFGAFGFAIDRTVVHRIAERARDRGRDGGAIDSLPCGGGTLVLGAWRATPTTEPAAAPPQPYGGIVHNGTIANDQELGNPEGMVDSMVLPSVFERRDTLADIFAGACQLRGSFAMAIAGPTTAFLVANYKPIYFARIGSAIYFASMERHLAPEMPWSLRAARMEPYSVLDLSTGMAIPLPRQHHGDRALVIASGGLDSTTAAYMIAAQGRDVSLMHFRYGCRAGTQEALRVKAIADHMGLPWHVLDIDYHRFTGGSPLFDPGAAISGPITGAEFAKEWVPARNLLMIAHAVAFAEANGFGSVVLGNNLEEAGAYPDNEEEFTHLLDQTLDYAVAADHRVRLEAPVGHLMKHEIVAEGQRIGVPWHLTWSCYRGGSQHCGRCGPCFMRREAFRRNGMDDPVFPVPERATA